MVKYSTIKLTTDTKSRLKSLAIIEGESYEHIIRRLLDVKLNGQQLDYSIRTSVDNRLCVKCCVDWGAERENIYFYNHDGVLSRSIVKSDDIVFNEFVDEIMDCDNIIRLLAILEYGEEICVGNLVFKRE